MAKHEHKREYFDEMDEVKSPMGKVVGVAILVHAVAFVYVYLWQLVLTM